MYHRYIIQESISQQFTLNGVPHKRVYSQLNSQELRRCFEQLDAPLTESITEATLRGIYLLNDWMVMKEVMNKRDGMQGVIRWFGRREGQRRKKAEGSFSRGGRGRVLQHQRINTFDSSPSPAANLQRAQIINEIIFKLNSQQKHPSNRTISPRPNKLVDKPLVVGKSSSSGKPLLVRDTNRLRSIENKSATYFGLQEQNLKSKMARFETKQSFDLLAEEKEWGRTDKIKENRSINKGVSSNKNNSYAEEPSSTSSCVFRRLRNEITKVKQEVEELRVTNREYMRENQVLRMRSREKENRCCSGVGRYRSGERRGGCQERGWRGGRVGRCNYCGNQQVF